MALSFALICLKNCRFAVKYNIEGVYKMNKIFYYIIGLVIFITLSVGILCNNQMIDDRGSFSEEELSEMEIVENSFEENIFGVDNYGEMSVEDRKSLAESVLENLSEQKYIDGETILYDEENATYTFTYQSGALGTLIIKDWTSGHDGIVN